MVDFQAFKNLFLSTNLRQKGNLDLRSFRFGKKLGVVFIFMYGFHANFPAWLWYTYSLNGEKWAYIIKGYTKHLLIRVQFCLKWLSLQRMELKIKFIVHHMPYLGVIIEGVGSMVISFFERCFCKKWVVYISKDIYIL